MKKILLILVFSMLFSTNSFSKNLIPWKNNKNFELVWECGGQKNLYLSFVLRNANPAAVFLSNNQENIRDLNNNRSIAFRDPQNNRSFIFFDNTGGQILKRFHNNLTTNTTASLKISGYPRNKSTEKEYKKWINLKAKDARSYIKFMTNYSEKLYKISEKLVPVNSDEYSCKLIGNYKLN